MGCTLARVKPMQGPIPHRPHCRNKRREIPAARTAQEDPGKNCPTLSEHINDNKKNNEKLVGR